jgi:hypothetical protein
VEILENTSELMQADFICSDNVHSLDKDMFLDKAIDAEL